MKLKKSLLLFTLVTAFIHFSPQLASATPDINKESDVSEIDKETDTQNTETEEVELEEEGELEEEVDSTEDGDEPEVESTDGSASEKETDAERDSQVETETETEQKEIVEDQPKEEVPVEKSTDPSVEKQQEIAPAEEETPNEEDKEEEEASNQITTFSVQTSGQFQLGDSDKAIAEMKKKLNAIGFNGIAVTNNFGAYTKERVEDFQKNYELSVTGIADQSTLSKLDEVYRSKFQLGKSHNDIARLKEKLNRMGFNGITVTNYYGNFTAKKVKEFQRFVGMKANGIADSLTRSKLDELNKNGFQVGDNHRYIASIKENLNELGFNGIAVTNYYGDYTAQKVREFQKFYGLEVTGKANAATLNKLDEAIRGAFKLGDSDKAIAEMKKKLNAIGFNGIAVTNYFGAYTKERVGDFQENYELSVTGIADQTTLTKLDEVYNSLFQLGKSHNDIAQLKEKLNRMGFNGITVTNYYGDFTAKKVKEFQRFVGMKANGIADSLTRSKLDELNKNGFEVGDSHPYIASIKENLNELGFNGIAVTNYYGDYTAQKVREFQKFYGLEVTGKANAATLNKLDEALRTYQLGDSDKAIAEMKKKLNAIGFNGITVTNYFGEYTKDKVQEFQNYYGLPVTGIVDLITLLTLDEVYHSSLQLGERNNDISTLKTNLNRLGFNGIAVTTYFGDYTEGRLEEFQSFYGLKVNGIADKVTLAKIDEILSGPLQKGKRDAEIITLKENLNTLGYDGIAVTNYFGDYTEKRLKEFQADYDLPVSGIADEVTLEKIDEAIQSRTVYNYTQYDLTLQNALDIQMAIKNPPPQTDLYRNSPAYISSNYINISQSGAIYSGGNVKVRTEPRLVSSTHRYTLTPGTKVTIQGSVKGDEFEGSTDWYKITYKGETLYAHKHLIDPNATIATTTANLNVRSQPNSKSDSHVYGVLPKGTEVVIVRETGNWYEISYNAWRNATRADTEVHLNPENNDIFQHLDLSSYAGATAAELNAYLEGKGILQGMGQAFIDASKKHNINELYLVSHALLETGNGTSKLSTGIVVDGKKVYNMFGINAYDSCPQTCGAQKAFDEGWDTPYKAIVGGAKFIGELYIHNEYKQNTIYKMRWNPMAMEKTGQFGKQYATDIGWASKQVPSLKDMYGLLDNPLFKFNIVKYK